ncbi:hypothetical protein KUTeg_008162, partial [Tegillarca granosa]
KPHLTNEEYRQTEFIVKQFGSGIGKELHKKEKMRVDKDNKGNRLCMNQFYRAFSTCRIPGIKRDRLLYYFQTESEGPTPKHIVLRSRLSALHPENYQNLECIQKAIEGVSLDDDSPVDNSDVFQYSLAGDPTNRWFDKSAVNLFYKNGFVSSTCDHAPLDAMVAVSNTFYIDLSIRKCKGLWEGTTEIHKISLNLQGTTEIRDLPKPKELMFHLDDVILEGIQTAKNMFLAVGANLQCYTRMYEKYGKKFLRKHKLHPDTHVQLALQYAYYKKYKRTETMRPCTEEAIEWSKAMLDPKTSMETKRTLYLKAANKHNKLMAEAQQNQVFGGVVPMMENGYGVFYHIETNTIEMVVTAWKSGEDTDAEEFLKLIYKCFDEMKSVVNLKILHLFYIFMALYCSLSKDNFNHTFYAYIEINNGSF